MITGLEASKRVFQILNVQGVKSLLDGAIYTEEPTSEILYQKRNISLFPLGTSNEDFLSGHVININVYCPDLASGQSDDVMIDIGNAVISTLRAYRATADYFTLDPHINTNLVKDENNRSYLNIRIEITTE
jgi:hypothetical protein